MIDYPKRPKFFAHRVVRMMQKTCAANDIGIEACWLVTCIAHVEDAKRYTGPVTFWNHQLMPIAGCKSWGRLDRARKAAVADGWLVYQPGKTRGCGTYWTNIPDHAASLDDSPVDESDGHQNGAHDGDNHQNGAHNGDAAVMRRRWNGEPSNPVPDPVPILIDSFDRFWNTYANKVGRKKSEPAFEKAVRSIAASREITPQEAVEFLIQRATEYVADCTATNRYQKNPLTWLNGAHWEDEFTGTTSSDFAEVHSAVLSIYTPDLRNHADVERALTPVQAQAARQVGIDRIYRSKIDDRAVQAAYADALRAGA